VKAKLRRDGHIIGYGDQEQVDYMCAFLKGEAAKYMQPTHEEVQYLELVRDILNNGERRPDRTGTGTLSIFAPRLLKFQLRGK
jgi:hypothetical protein